MNERDVTIHRGSIELNTRMGNKTAGIHKAAVFFQKEFDRVNRAWEEHRNAVSMLRGLQVACKEFTDVAFPNVNVVSVLSHMSEELTEVSNAPDDRTEHADLLMLQLCMLSIQDISIEEVMAAAWAKLEVNKRRKWVEGKDGGYRHKK